MASTALLSTVVMSGLLLAVIAIVLRARRWQHPAPTVAAARGALGRRVNGPLGWSIAFVFGTLLVTGLGMFYAGGEPVAGLEPATLGLGMAASLALVIGIASIIAVYGTAESRGLNSAQSAAVSAVFLFTLFLIAIVVQLFVGG